MTKREICERLLEIRDSAMFASGGTGDIGGAPCYDIGKALRDLLLDLAAPEAEEKQKPEAVKEEQRSAFRWPDPCGCKGDAITAEELKVRESPKEKRPPLIIFKDADEKRPCPQCGQPCIRDLVLGQYFCRTHGSFKPKEATK